MTGNRTDRTRPDGTVILPRAAMRHLRAALEQMDLLLESQEVEVGLAHLVALLQHLRAFRQEAV